MAMTTRFGCTGAAKESEKRNDQETFLDRNCLRTATIGWGNIGPDLGGGSGDGEIQDRGRALSWGTRAAPFYKELPSSICDQGHTIGSNREVVVQLLLPQIAPSHRKVALQFACRMLLGRGQCCWWGRQGRSEALFIHLRDRHSAKLGMSVLRMFGCCSQPVAEWQVLIQINCFEKL